MYWINNQFSGENDILLIYTRHRPFSWSQTTLGLFKGTETLLRGLGMLILMPICKRLLQARDTVLMLAGLTSKMIAVLFIALSPNTTVMFIGLLGFDYLSNLWLEPFKAVLLFQGFFCTVCASGERRRSQSKRPCSQWNLANIFPNWKYNSCNRHQTRLNVLVQIENKSVFICQNTDWFKFCHSNMSINN